MYIPLNDILGKQKEQLWAQQPKKEEQSKPEGKRKCKVVNRGENRKIIRFDQQNKSWFGEVDTQKKYKFWRFIKEKRKKIKNKY